MTGFAGFWQMKCVCINIDITNILKLKIKNGNGLIKRIMCANIYKYKKYEYSLIIKNRNWQIKRCIFKRCNEIRNLLISNRMRRDLGLIIIFKQNRI